MNEKQKLNLINQTIKLMNSIGLTDYKTEQAKFYLKTVIFFVLISIPPSILISIFKKLNISLGGLPVFLLYGIFFALYGYIFKKILDNLYVTVKKKLSEDFLKTDDFEIIEDSITRNRLIEFTKEFGVYPYPPISSDISTINQMPKQANNSDFKQTNFDFSIFKDEIED